MLRNYLKLSWRTLAKNSVYSIIVISGLTLAFACGLFTLLFVLEENSYDRHSTDSHRIFRVVKDFVNDDGTIIPDATTPAAMGPLILRDVAGVASMARMYPPWGSRTLVTANGKSFYESRIFGADPGLFSVFSFEAVSGDPDRALANKSEIVITSSLAKKYFGTDDAVGKTMVVGSYRDSLFTVGAVIEDLPHNMHFHFDMAVPIYVPADSEQQWDLYNYYTYIKIQDETNIADVEPMIVDVFHRHRPGRPHQYHAQAVTDIHLKSSLKWELEPNGSQVRVAIFITVAAFILLIAAVNYINLSIVQSLNRAKEVGIRKVSGAGGHELIVQFLQESLLVCVASFVAAVGLVQLLLPWINVVFEQNLPPLFSLPPATVALVIMGVVAIALLSGLYPAVFLSAFRPAEVLKGAFQPTGRSLVFRKALVVFQFAISIALMTGSMIVFRQVNFMQTKDPGFNKDQVIVLRNAGDVPNKEAFKNAVAGLADVVAVAGSSGLIGGENWTTQASAKGANVKSQLNFTAVDHAYPDLVGVEIVAGRTFDKDLDTRTTTQKIILNETAVRDLGIEEDPIGALIDDESAGAGDSASYHEVIGVMRDFHFASFRNEIKPYAFYLFERAESNFVVKVSTSDYSDIILRLGTLWSEFTGGKPFEYGFLDQQFGQMFKADEQFRIVFMLLTLTSVYIACSGLFAVASFFIKKRTKEISIRKVLGASVFQVTWLVGNRFILLVAVANLIAWPVTYWFMDDWLNGFAYRVDIDWSLYLSASAAALLIAAVTVGSQSFRAATSNPVDSLKAE